MSSLSTWIPGHPNKLCDNAPTLPVPKKCSSKQVSVEKEGSSNDHISRSYKIMAVPRLISGRQSPSPQPMKTSHSLPSPTPNLLDFYSAPSSLSKSATSTVDLLTGLTQSPPTSTSSRDLMDTSQTGSLDIILLL